MKKRFLSLTLAVMLVTAALVGCGSASQAPAAAETPAASTETADSTPAADRPATNASGTQKIGVAMPTQSSERWINDGKNIKEQLEAIGYEVELQYAEDDVQAQVSQIENLVASGVDCLVVAAVDSAALVNALAQAKNAGIPVIAYDRLLMDTDAVSYYATFDNKGVGTAIAEYVVKKADLANANGKTYNFEMFMGSPDDNNAHMLYAGIMEVIQPYIDNGTLVCQSGQIEFEKNNTLRWDQQTAMKRCEDILNGFYADKKVDIIFSAFDGLSYGCKSALDGAGYKVGVDYPIITGQDAELMACKNINAGFQTMTIFKDTRVLAAKCVTMVEAVLKGSEPEINDTNQYNNNVITVPSYLCTPEPVDKDNLTKAVVDSGYYTADQLNN